MAIPSHEIRNDPDEDDDRGSVSSSDLVNWLEMYPCEHHDVGASPSESSAAPIQQGAEPATQLEEEPATQLEEEPATQLEGEPATQLEEEPATQLGEEPATQQSAGFAVGRRASSAIDRRKRKMAKTRHTSDDCFHEHVVREFNTLMRNKTKRSSLLTPERCKQYRKILEWDDSLPWHIPIHFSAKEKIAWSSEYHRVRHDFELFEGRLYRRHKRGRKEVATTETALDIIRDRHCEGGHFGTNKTFDAVNVQYHGITYKDICWLLKRCTLCSPVRAIKLRPLIRPTYSHMPFEHVQIDLMNSRSDPSGPDKWILQVKDHFSKFTVLYPLKDKTSREVARNLNTFMNYCGPPTIIEADNEEEFKGVVTALLAKRGVEFRTRRCKALQAQGLRGKSNGTTKDRLASRTKSTNIKNWHRELRLVENATNTSTCAGLPSKVTPWELLYGRPRDLELDRRRAYLDTSFKELDELFEQGVVPDCVRRTYEKFPAPQNFCDETQASSKTIAESEKIFADLYDRTRERQATVRAKMAAKYAANQSIRLFDVGEYVEVRLPVGPRSSLDTKKFEALVITKTELPHPTYKVLSRWGVLDRAVIVSEMNEIKTEMIPRIRELLVAAPRARIISMAVIGDGNLASEVVPVS